MGENSVEIGDLPHLISAWMRMDPKRTLVKNEPKVLKMPYEWNSRLRKFLRDVEGDNMPSSIPSFRNGDFEFPQLPFLHKPPAYVRKSISLSDTAHITSASRFIDPSSGPTAIFLRISHGEFF
ncbi:hypothetical protein A3C21_03520 [Candidatus Kaiserbacteria bacterium RIFCSPHIGHO2_02_FULL_59_21]|uniref:Uncharacterized protein n=1 Tax=Candidatus Kaiserbacteria bacterium RIFCSPHIGHO2_02_FULL_59_21 TaxID=1798500 RepID=A0A1F6E118_9BACT|nr:MAG: hypothetical protein A2766_01565 [Candidatus Kaiserbacteria bacterium RIFCSPHIGHO2_01_FULL_58_22]OGG67395.1 MAG: hypothetical protein A3C21_03520 [Candidatus Kaiserbacteria bacterium RIFCSPHIGHO2_02_FULL_59_21]OGG78909.1 MAG: hypothetical protein A2952_00955 [Candidatus Kaiserbacteria bacterium RIFCSPLOWO2_01_FULL_59_34]OGG85944.1 MAG: hypothetical protein A3I47_01490 [Candidatus Kaiserbacteria bacterium RIFCSPLOWO2_02_FULL_59_19]